MSPIIMLAAVMLVSCALGDNNTVTTEGEGDTCGVQPDEGPWSAALEDWVTADRVYLTRHGRIMALPPSQGYYVSDRIDLMPPPPPPHHGPHHMYHRGPYPAYHGPHHGPSDSGPHHGPSDSGPHHGPSDNGLHYGPSDQTPHRGPPDHGSELPARLQSQPSPPKASPPSGPPPQTAQGSASMPYDEWQATPPPPPGAGKIVNRPPNPYKDQFKPSYPPPSPPQQSIPVHGLSDRVDEARPPPHKQVSETDLYLLGAIEKLVYRVDLMEKRLRKMEENMHYLVVGTEPKPEPCKSNFTRVGGACYHVSSEALNWKNANYACRKLKGHLLELDAADEKRSFTTGLLAEKNLRGSDFWTGGLNPGLLWIWSHSAAAVANTTADAKDSATIVGEGRCLALVHDPTVNSYVYRGQDCSLRHRYVCEINEDKTKLGNEIERVARTMRHNKQRIPKMKWSDDLS